MRLQIYTIIAGLLILFKVNIPLQAKPEGITKILTLYEHVAYEIPINTREPTTIRFPSKLEMIEGINVTKGDHKTPISMTHLGQNTYFTVKANKIDAEGALNIMSEGKLYALKLIVSEDACRYVQFIKPKVQIYEANQLIDKASAMNPDSLLKLLDTSKMLHLLSPELHSHIFNNISTSSPKTIDDYGKFWILLDEVIQFKEEDTLVFRIIFKNKTNEPIYYAPQSLAVRVGEYIYNASLVDASGIISEEGETFAYFCITGKADGSRANLSLTNTFLILLYELPHEPIL